jgi:hypothetical protein
VGRLSSLQTLILDTCTIETPPAEIGQLESLETFIIRQSFFMDGNLEFPAEELVKLKQLKEIVFDTYSFPIVRIEELGSMKSLKRLTLEHCDMLDGQEFSASINQLQNLDDLNIVRCRNFEGLPVEIGQLTNLKSLCLLSSLITVVPSELIGNLTQLEKLEISCCCLPREVGDLENLKHLRLHLCDDTNPFESRTDDDNDESSNDKNRMEEIHSVIGRLSQLESLKLSAVTHAFKLPFLRHLKSLVLDRCHTGSVLQAFEDQAWKEAESLEHLCIERTWECHDYAKILRGLPSTLKVFEMNTCVMNSWDGFITEGFPIGIQRLSLCNLVATSDPFQPYVLSDKDRSLLEKHWQLCDL